MELDNLFVKVVFVDPLVKVTIIIIIIIIIIITEFQNY
jgi:hypothetical protein